MKFIIQIYFYWIFLTSNLQMIQSPEQSIQKYVFLDPNMCKKLGIVLSTWLLNEYNLNTHAGRFRQLFLGLLRKTNCV